MQLIVFHQSWFIPMVACVWNTKHCDASEVHRSMSPSAQITSEQLKIIIEDERKIDKSARVVVLQVEDGEEVISPDNSGSVLNTVPITINNDLEHEWLEEVVRRLIVHPIHESIADQVRGNNYSIPGLPWTKFLVHLISVRLVIVTRLVWHSDLPGVLVADEMGLGKTFTSVAASIICKLLTEKVALGLLLTMLWGNTLDEWLNMVQHDYPRIVGIEWEWYSMQSPNSVSCPLLGIHTTPPQGHPALTSAHEPIQVVTMPRVAETFKCVINKMT